MTEVNFNNIPEPVEKVTNRVERVTKGAQTLTITGIEDVMANSGTPGFEVSFKSSKNMATFTHKFWNTEKALVRLQNLVTGFTGEKPSGTMNTQQLSALLVGQSSNCIVDVDIRINTVGDKVYRNEYPTLRFTGFANKTQPFIDTDARVNEPTEQAKTTTVDELPNVSFADELDGLPF